MQEEKKGASLKIKFQEHPREKHFLMEMFQSYL